MKSTYRGGKMIKASLLQRGDTVRDPRKKDRILIVQEVGATIFVRGLEKNDQKHHRFFDKEQLVILVTQAETETSVPLEDGDGQ